MGPTVLAGVVLGVLVTLWSLVVVYTGWYLDPAMVWTFWIVVLIEIVVLIRVLRQAAADGHGYWGRVSAGFLVSVVAGIIIFGGSLLITTVLVPEYSNEIRAKGAELARQAGQGDAVVQRLLETPAKSPALNALEGSLGTVITGLVVSLIAAPLLRVRPRPGSGAG